MKVLHVSARADFGGGPEHMYQQVLGQVEVHDIKCFLACPDDYPYYDRYLDAVGSENIFLIPHRKFNMLSLLNLIRFVRKNKIEIIHSHGKGAGVYSRLLSVFLGVSCIHTFHGLHIGEYSKISKYLYIGLEHTFSFFTTRIICVSSGELESIVSESIAPREKLVQIDNGVKVPVRVESRSKSSQLKVLAVNRFDDQKNPELLVGIASAIKASSMYGQIKITVIGEGDRFELCSQMVHEKDLGDVISLVGATTNPRKFMSEADVFLSTSRWEGMPLAVLEAMSEGLPVVATQVVGNEDVIQSGVEGLLFKTDDALSALVPLEMMLDPVFRVSCSAAARKTVSEYYSTDIMVEKTVRIYKEI